MKSLACVPKLDATLERFRSRPLEGTSPSVRLEAKAVRVRQEGQVVSMAVGGVREEGQRGILGARVGGRKVGVLAGDCLRILVAGACAEST